MKTYQIILFLVMSTLSSLACASQKPLHTFTLKSEDSFAVEGSGQISIYGLSELMKSGFSEKRPSIVAAGHTVGPLIRTKDPNLAVQKLLGQISTQSGLRLSAVHDTFFAPNISPAVVLMGVSTKSVWHIILAPKGDGLYRLGITCVIDR